MSFLAAVCKSIFLGFCGLEVPSDVFRQSGPVALAGVSDGEHCLAGGGAAGQPRPGSVVVTVTACGTARGQYTDRKNRFFYYKLFRPFRRDAGAG